MSNWKKRVFVVLHEQFFIISYLSVPCEIVAACCTCLNSEKLRFANCSTADSCLIFSRRCWIWSLMLRCMISLLVRTSSVKPDCRLCKWAIPRHGKWWFRILKKCFCFDLVLIFLIWFYFVHHSVSFEKYELLVPDDYWRCRWVWSAEIWCHSQPELFRFQR